MPDVFMTDQELAKQVGYYESMIFQALVEAPHTLDSDELFYLSFVEVKSIFDIALRNLVDSRRIGQIRDRYISLDKLKKGAAEAAPK